MNIQKKVSIIFVLLIYIFSFLMNTAMYWPKKAKAEDPITNHNLVALFVDTNIYSDISNRISWYSTQYIQQKLSNTQVLVFPINKSNFKAQDINKILENLYFEGIKSDSSRLIGTVLVGDLPLPVINNDGFIFPSIYPYVDFENKKYIYNYSTKYYELNQSNAGKPEIWHGLINLGNDSNDYKNFFKRLKKYSQDPVNYVDRKIWYADHGALKNSFNDDNLMYYINNFLFLEDVGLHRYTRLMFEIFNQDNADFLSENIENLGSKIDSLEQESQQATANADPEFDEFKSIAGQYFSKAKSFKQKFMSEDVQKTVKNNAKNIPTLLIKQSLDGMFKSIQDIFGTEYLNRMKKNILATGRYSLDDIDNEIKFIYIKDEIAKKIIQDYNYSLEEALDHDIDDKKYYMTIPIPVSYEYRKNNYSCSYRKRNGHIIGLSHYSTNKYLVYRYENFYFGKYADKINDAEKMTIFRGVYKNFNGLKDIENYSYTRPQKEDIPINIYNKSVGSSYALQTRQIEASRGYDIVENSKIDSKDFRDNRCINTETIKQYSLRVRGGHSPVNVEMDSNTSAFSLKNPQYKYAWNPTYDQNIGGELYDIKGSSPLKSAETNAYSYKAYNKYDSLIKTENTNGVPEKYCLSSNKTTTTPNQSLSIYKNGYKNRNVQLFDLFRYTNYNVRKYEYIKVIAKGDKGNKEKVRYKNGIMCKYWQNDILRKEFYQYNLIDSRVFHKNPTKDQINSMNQVTKERPIDDPRYVSFMGVKGTEVKLQYPNLYNVEVFKKVGSKLELKTVSEIETAIRNYLKAKANKQINDLKIQHDGRIIYYNQHKNAFNFLTTVDSLASPNRNYTLFSENFYINALGDENIKRAAHNLYYLNVMWQERQYSMEVLKDLDYLKTQHNINYKFDMVGNDYLSSTSEDDKVINPGYVKNGYEVGYISSDGGDPLVGADLPDIISDIVNAQSANGSYSNVDNLNYGLQSQKDDTECGISSDGSVMIWQWPSAMACRLQKTLSKPFEISIDYSCSMGTVMDIGLGGEEAEEDECISSDPNTEPLDPYKYLAGDKYLRYDQSQFISKYNPAMWNDYIALRRNFAGADTHFNKKNYDKYSVSQKQVFTKIENSLEISVKPSANILVDDYDPSDDYYIKIGSRQDVGSLSLSIGSVGDHCLKLNGIDVCKQNLNIVANNYYNNESIIHLNLQGRKSGVALLLLKFCNGNNVCYNKNLMVNIIPGKIKKIDIISPPSKILKGGQLPFNVMAYDSYNNPLGQIIQSYKISTDLAKMKYLNRKGEQFEFNDFKQAYFLYDTEGLQGVADVKATINIEASEAFKQFDPSLPSKTKEIFLVNGDATLFKGGAKITNFTYNLPNSFEDIYQVDANGLMQIKESSILKFKLELKADDGTNLESPVKITTANNLMSPGVLESKEKVLTINGVAQKHEELGFVPQNNFLIENGVIEFYLHPTFRAGGDQLIISIPGLDDKKYNINVVPAEGRFLDIEVDKLKMNIGEQSNAKIYLKDVWGNIATNQSKQVKIGVIGNIKINNSSDNEVNIDINNGEGSFKLNAIDPGGKAYIYGLLNGLNIDDYYPDYEEVQVNNVFWPYDNMNVMYLNLYGNDWGNLRGYFSPINKLVHQMFNNSDKMLGLTTQLVDPKSVSKTEVMVRGDGFVSKSSKTYDLYLGMKGTNIYYVFGKYGKEAGSIKIGKSIDFNIQRVNKVPSILNGNQIYYIPEEIDSIILANEFKDNNKIVINDNVIIDFSNGEIAEGVEVKLGDKIVNGLNMWEIMYNGKLIGKLGIYRGGDTQIISGFPVNSDLDEIGKTMIIFGEGSTNGAEGISIYNEDKKLSETQKSYKSIEDANDSDLNMGFRNNFKNINAFANGNSMGESTKLFASEFLINFGDPVLTRIDKSKRIKETQFDGGIGKVVYSDTDKNILKVINIDFNNDKLEDLIVVYKDGSIRLIKNYGGNEPFVDLGEVMIIPDGISDIGVGDVDGNGYDDIIVKTGKGMLRVYHNFRGVFEVNGKIICLDVPGGPKDLGDVTQIFFEDMDKDNKLDIVTNDRSGDIKIFYGGSGPSGDYYVSNDVFTCDDHRKSRQKQKLVKNYGLELSSDSVYDSSLVHWNGLVRPGPNTTDDVNIGGLDPTNITPSSINNLITQGMYEEGRYQDLPLDFAPSFEKIQGDNVSYSEIYYLESPDPVKIHKKYQGPARKLKAGDIVKVNIVIEASQSTIISYIENLQGPWAIIRGKNGKIQEFDYGNLPNTTTINWNPKSGFVFMLDNLKINAGQTISFSYPVMYKGSDLVTIDVLKINGDKYPDIKTNLDDGCIKGYWKFLAKNSGKDYDETFVDYQNDFDNKVNKYVDNIDNDYKKNADIFDKLNNRNKDYSSNMRDAVDNNDAADGLKEIKNLGMGEVWDTASLIKADASVSGPDISVDFTLFDAEFSTLKESVNNVLHGLCNGFKFDDGNCGGIPVPFNTAFLSPGTYNIFGCRLMQDPGFPIFRFPGTLWIPVLAPCVIPVPIPYGAHVIPPIDNPNTIPLLSCPGIYPQMIRIYLSPTTTGGLGLSVCFGAYKAGMLAPPNPMGNIAGNCIVVAARLPLGSCSAPNVPGPNEDNSSYVIEPWQYDLLESGSCKKRYVDGNKNSSPFQLKTSGGGGVKGNGWGLYIDESPTDLGDFPEIDAGIFKLERVDLKPGKPFQLKIQSGDLKGLVPCIIKKWIDKQLRYIINNLTQMTIYLYLPDMSGLTKGFDNIHMGRFMQKLDQMNETSIQPASSLQNAPSTEVGKKINEIADKAITPITSFFDSAEKTMSNPFKLIEKMFDDVPLINVKTKDIVIQIPFPPLDEVEKYIRYLETWVEKQKAIAKEWQYLGQDLAGTCGSLTDQDAKAKCNETSSKYISISVDISGLINTVQQNIQTLYEYKNFPLKLYKRIHVVDRYISEILCIIDKFLSSIVGWLDENADRLEKRVDFIILLIGIIDTYQILIDFSVSWRSKCAQCSKDEYDFYSCNLSLLCIDLPILPIPPFKLPDIILDFSHINLGIDIVLPTFSFKLIQLPMISLPDLPYPPKVGLSVSLPEIPLLPPPPELPELPSFLPTIELKLPLLPPAPKIPPLLPSIKIILNIAEFIGFLYCILKMNIGLVAEWNVKTRIEQLTQRTNRIFPFDFFKVTMPEIPLQGFDIRIDAYVNLRFSFDLIYQMAESIADQINSMTNVVSDELSGIDVDIGLPSTSFDNYQFDVDLGAFNYTGGYEYEYALNKLNNELEYFKLKDKDSVRKLKIEKVIGMINRPKYVKPNIKGIENIGDQVKTLVKENRKYLQDLEDKIKNNYTEFLDEVKNKNNILVSDMKKDVTLSTSLFNVDENTKNTIQNQEDPMKTYIDLNMQMIDGFENSLAKHTPESLNMTPEVYQKSKNYLAQVRKQIDVINPYYNEDIVHKVMAAPQSNSKSMVDPSQYVKGFFVSGNDNKYYNVVNWMDKGNKIFQDNDYKKLDINHDGHEDLLLWDNNNIYIKYQFQNDNFNEGNIKFFSDFYEVGVLNSVEALRTKVDTKGYISLHGKKYKVWDARHEVNNFERTGSSYENISMAWNKNQDQVVGYVLKLAQRVDLYYDKDEEIDRNILPDTDLNKRYVLIVPTDLDENTVKIQIPGKGAKFIADYDTGTIIKVYKRDFKTDSLSAVLEDLEENWFYVKSAPLTAKQSGGVTMLNIVPVWSNQIVAGTQIWADNESPQLTVTLVRTKINPPKAVGTGNTLQGYINTHYNLVGTWTDNGQIMDTWVEYEDKSIDGSSVNGLYYTGTQTINFVFGAIDHAANKEVVNVSLNIGVPNLDIETVDTNGGAGGTVIAKLSHDIDDGTVRFERARNGYWYLMTGFDGGSDTSEFEVDTEQEYVTGSIFELSNDVILYNTLGNNIGKIETDTGKISIKPEYQDHIKVYVDFKEKLPIIVIKDEDEHKILFKMFLKSKSLSEFFPVTLYQSLELVDIESNMVGIFKGGYCIKETMGECMVYISKDGTMYVPEPYNSEYWGKYIYDDLSGETIYEVYDSVGVKQFDVRFIAEALK